MTELRHLIASWTIYLSFPNVVDLDGYHKFLSVCYVIYGIGSQVARDGRFECRTSGLQGYKNNLPM